MSGNQEVKDFFKDTYVNFVYANAKLRKEMRIELRQLRSLRKDSCPDLSTMQVGNQYRKFEAPRENSGNQRYFRK